MQLANDPSSLKPIRRHHRMILVGVAVALTAGLVVASVIHARSERERDTARPAVCKAVGELYRAALDGPVAPTAEEEWDGRTDQIATQLSALSDPFGMSTKVDRFRGEVHNRRPSLIRKAALDVGCVRSTFPPVQSAVFDTTPVDWASTASAPAVEPAVVHLSGAQLPPESAVAANIRGATFQTLADAGVPIDMIPLIDLSQARIAWIGNQYHDRELRTVIRFAAKLEDGTTAIHSITAVAAALPEMVGATVDESRWAGFVESSDDMVWIRVSLPQGDTEDTDFIEIERSASVHTNVPPPALEQTLSYAAGPLTGAHSKLFDWWVQLGTDPKSKATTDYMGFGVNVQQAVEPVMDNIARSIGAWKKDGSHLLGQKLVDPTHHDFYWKFLGAGVDSTIVYVVQKAHTE